MSRRRRRRRGEEPQEKLGLERGTPFWFYYGSVFVVSCLLWLSLHEHEDEEEEERSGRKSRARRKDVVLVLFWFRVCGVVLVGAIVA